MKYKLIVFYQFLTAIFFLCILMGNLVVYGAVIKDDDEFGEISHYNAFVFEHFEATQGVMEGALASGGEAKFGTASGQFDIGAAAAYDLIGHYENPGGNPSVLLAEGFQIGTASYGNVSVHGGPVVLNEKRQPEYEASKYKFYVTDPAGVLYAGSEVIQSYFHDAYNTAKSTAQVLLNAYQAETMDMAALQLKDFVGWNTRPGVFDDLERFTPDNLANTDNLKITVLNVMDKGHVEINGPQLTGAFGASDLVIINLPYVTSARFTGASVHVDQKQINTSSPKGTDDNKLLREYAEKIIWNFPEAESIQMVGTGGVGAILAPDAHMEGTGGSMNGSVIVESLYIGGGMGLHSFRLNERVFDFTNEEAGENRTGTVQLKKYDGNPDGKPLKGEILLPGAKFDLYKKSDDEWQKINTDPFTTGMNGLLEIKDLSKGHYYLKETEAPYGYHIEEKEYQFHIDEAHGIETPVVIQAPKSRIKTSVVVQKVDAYQPEKGLKGAKFILYYFNGRTIEIVTQAESDEQGYMMFEDLPYGHYRFLEIEAPDEYNNPFEDYIDLYVSGDDKGNVTISYENAEGEVLEFDNTNILKLKNRQQPSSGKKRLVVTKLDIDDLDIPLQGAEFTLAVWSDETNKWEELYSDLRTDLYGHVIVEELEDGEYKLTETNPPLGYDIVDASLTFQLKSQDGEGLYRPAEDTKYIEVYNKAKGRILVEKTDSTDEEKKLPGAEFKLYYNPVVPEEGTDSRWEAVAEGITDENGELLFEELKPGRYSLIQTKAPEGYKPIVGGENTGFVVIGYLYDENGEMIEYPTEEKIQVTREPEYGYVSVYKVDGDIYYSEEYESTHGLTGAEFDLYKFDDHEYRWGLYRENITMAAGIQDGRVIIGGLQSGNYKLIETKAPEGYEFETEFDQNEFIFTIDAAAEGNEPELVIPNYKIQNKKTVILEKIDADSNQKLYGAIFDIEVRDGEAGGSYQEYLNNLVTNEAGEVEITGLKAGEYRLVERIPPKGYQTDGDNMVEFQIVKNENELAVLPSDRIVVGNKAVILDEDLTGEGEAKGKNDKSVSTGDSSSILWLAALLFVSSGILMYIVKIRKKH